MMKQFIIIFTFIMLTTMSAASLASAQSNTANQGISQSNTNIQKGDSNTNSQSNTNTGSNIAGQVIKDGGNKDKTSSSDKKEDNSKTTKDNTKDNSYVPPKEKDKSKNSDNNSDKSKDIKCGSGYKLDKKTKKCVIVSSSSSNDNTSSKAIIYTVPSSAVFNNNNNNAYSSSSSTTYKANTKNIFQNSYITSQGTGIATPVPSTLLLLNSKQILEASGDAATKNLEAIQSLFCTTQLKSIYSEQKKEWFITGSVMNVNTVSTAALDNVKASALFYNLNGDEVGSIDNIPVNPTTLSLNEEGTYTFQASLDTDLHGQQPTFIVMNYNIQP